MTFLVDTNVLSELRKGPRAQASVRRWFESVDSEDLFLSVIAVGEIRKGIESVRRRDPEGAGALERWLRQVISSHGGRVLEVDVRVAEEWGRLSVPNPIPVLDGLMAATARVHNLTLVTRNIRDVARTGVSVLNPFDAS